MAWNWGGVVVVRVDTSAHHPPGPFFGTARDMRVAAPHATATPFDKPSEYFKPWNCNIPPTVDNCRSGGQNERNMFQLSMNDSIDHVQWWGQGMGPDPGGDLRRV